MAKFREWLTTQKSDVQLTIAVIIGLVVVIFGGINIVSAIKDFGSKKMKEGLKSLGYAALIIFINHLRYSEIREYLSLIYFNEERITCYNG